VSSFSNYRDPVIERVQAKLGKQYDFSGPIELIAFYELQGSLTIEFVREKLASVLREGLPRSPFRRAWVYGHRERRILLVVPSIGCLGVGVLRRRL